jgi:hypothetical protein
MSGLAAVTGRMLSLLRLPLSRSATAMGPPNQAGHTSHSATSRVDEHLTAPGSGEGVGVLVAGGHAPVADPHGLYIGNP